MNTSIHAAPPSNAEQSRTHAASTSASGTTSPSNAVPAQPTAKSYANAATRRQGPPVVASSAPQVAVGGSQAPQHGKANSISPVNGNKSIPPAVPSVGPAIASSSGIANGSTSAPGHDRKSSVTITSSQGYMQNGGAAANPNRASITFGSMNAGGSPAIANSVLHSSQNASLPTPPTNPRVTSPSHSPSPIPTPAPSGGRPPSSLQNQPIPLNFGSTAGDSNDQNMRAVSMPQGPGLVPQAQHLRRESSQSSHSDMSGTPGMPSHNRPFPQGNGRGRGGFQPNYPGGPQMANSPGPQYRQPYPQQHRPGSQMQYGPPQSPNLRSVSAGYPQGGRSPHVNPAQLHQQNMANGMHFPQFMHQQQMYGMNPQFDQNFASYYPQPPMQYGMYPGAPPSPRPPQFNSPHAPGGAYMQGGYGQQGQVPPMARTPSQGPERPPSALNPPSTPSIPSASVPTANQTSASPAPSATSSFTIPSKAKSKAIRITNADGVEVDFKQAAKGTTPSPAPVAASQAHPPALVASTPTPPPKSATPQQVDKETQPSVSAEEKRKAFTEAFKKQMASDAAKQEPVQEAAKTAEEAIAVAPVVKPEHAKEETKVESEAKKEDVPPPTTSEAPPQAAPADVAPADEGEDEMERMIREMEEEDRKREEQEKAYAEKKAKEKAEQKAREEAEKANEDEELKRQEREAEERELARDKAREQGNTETDDDAAAKAKAEFAALKKPTLGPGAASAEDSGISTPEPESAPAPTEQQDQPTALKAPTSKPKPTALKLETNKAVEPAQPTAGMQSLKSARFLEVKAQDTKYPEGVSSPNPSLNVSNKGQGRQYDKDFLLQFQQVFKEKPSVDWDQKIKDTIGDGEPQSGRPHTARTPSGMGPRQTSRGGMSAAPMGGFGTQMPPPVGRGTTSADRFAKSTPTGMPGMGGFGQFGRPGGAFPGPGMVRNPSQTNFQPARGLGPDSPRVGSSRGRGSKKPNAREEAEKAAKMPLTAGMDLKPLELSTGGWKATSLGPGAAAAAPPPGGRLTPDLVQRKVKAALNKMTPEKFEKIADDILTIAAQSKDETDGRTLRQVIQLTFEKACDEAHWASMYAKFAHRMLTTMDPSIKDETIKDKHGQPVVGGALFRKYLLNRCQEEFERGWEVNLPEKPEGESQEAVLLSDEYYIAAAAKRRGLGLIQFIGELYKLSMLTTRIMHECVLKLLNFEGLPDEAAIESLTKLLRTIGATMDTADPGRGMMNAYFDRINQIIDMEGLNSRLRFMLMDIRDLRKSNWKGQGDKGPKTIQEIHAEAAQAQAQAELERARNNVGRGGGRPPVGRGDARSFSGGGMPAPEYNRNAVNMADLKNLSRGAASRNSSNTLGPGSLLSNSRTNSNRKGLGPGSVRPGEDSGMSSRTGTPPAEKKEPTTSANAFSALAGLEAEEDTASQPATSPQPTSATPAVSNDLDARAAGEGGDAAKP